MTTITVPTSSDVRTRRTTGVPFSRTLHVELRKAFDTRASRWLVGIALALTIVLAGLVAAFPRQLIARADGAAGWDSTLMLTSFPLALLLPVVAILLVTTEWSQRTALTTFTSEPRRLRVVAAKALVAVAIGTVCQVVLFLVTAGASAVAAARGVQIDWTIHWGTTIAGQLLASILSVVMAFGFALALCNSPAAIVGYMALPNLYALAQLVPGLSGVAAWTSISTAAMPLTTGDWSGQAAGKLAVSALVWVGVPIAVGVWRHLRREVS